MLKQKGWDEFKKGKVINVNRNKKRAKATQTETTQTIKNSFPPLCSYM